MRIVRPEDVLKERKRREQRSEEVSEALEALSRDAHLATRKLDDTYYALLERLALLKQTLSSLQHLSAQASTARSEWQDDAEITGTEIEEKIESFAGFETQASAVDDLVSRLKNAKARAGELEGSLEGCRIRLEEFVHKEEMDRLVINKRWRMFWAALATALVLIVLVVVWRQNKGQSELLADLKGKGVEFAAEVGVVDKDRLNRTKVGIRLVDEGYEKQKKKKGKKWDRVLDEL